MAIYGRTWWGKRWLESFKGIDLSNRLPRGRTYANTGRAYDIKIKGNVVTALVTGSRPNPYRVKVTLNRFTQADKKIIHHIIQNSPSILSGLVNRRLPKSLFDELNREDILLFPSSWNDIEARCNCPDYAMPCKHIAAVIYLIVAEIDKNPFMVFTIHDCDLLTLIADFSDGKLGRIMKIPRINEFCKPVSNTKDLFDQSILDSINIASVPALNEQILAMLSDDPPFFRKNFRDILQLMYKQWRRYPSGDIDRFLYPRKVTFSKKKKLSEEDYFVLEWDNPERWDSFTFVIDNRHQLTHVLIDDESFFSTNWDVPRTVIHFLLDIPPSMLHTLNPHIRFMRMVMQFARTLMYKSALIPHVFQNDKGETLVRWLPALFDSTVCELYKNLCSVCPKDLVLYEGKFLSVEEQVKIAISVILSAYIYRNVPSALNRYADDPFFRMFFNQHPLLFKEFSDKEVPGAVQQWISKFYASERSHKLYLMVDDVDYGFTFTIHASLDDKKKPVVLKELLEKCEVETKLALLSDVSLLVEYVPELEVVIDNGRSVFFNLNDFSPLFLRVLPILKAVGIGVILPKSLNKIIRPELRLQLKSKESISSARKSFLDLETLCSFDWKVAIGRKKINADEFTSLLRDSRGLVRLFDQYVLVDEKEIASLLKKLDRLPDHLNQMELMQAVLTGESDGSVVEYDKQLKGLFDSLQSYTPAKTPHNLEAQLRPYQERGFAWLVQNIDSCFGSILADDMGLGKTLQIITTILHFKNKGLLKKDSVLIVVPTSLLSNWQREIKRFAPDLSVHIYHGKDRLLAEKYDIILTSYGIARTDLKKIKKISLFLLIIDEAQNIKNPVSKQTKSIKSIDAKHKIAMSGTPVENRLLEYWSIFDFVNKSYLGAARQFIKEFAVPIEKERDQGCLKRFLKITDPFMLRRLKSDKKVIKDLPDKVENNRYCSLTPEQTALYKGVVDMTMDDLESSEGIERKGRVLKLINALKQICNHPSQFSKKIKSICIDQSGKMQMLEEVMRSIEDSAEKVLIFTQYKQMGDIIVALLEEKFNSSVAFLHGGLSRKARDEMVHNFQNCSQSRILILSLKAGGTGLNLTAASHVIHYDLWWNPAVESQATDRAYRIGQTRKVIVHRFITTGTFEERINEMIQSKKELADLTVGTGEKWVTEMSNKQLKDLVSIRELSN